MVGLQCLMSQCAKLHVAGWTWAVFTRVCLESCTWPMAIFTIDQRKEQRVFGATRFSFLWSIVKIAKVTYTTPNKRVRKLPTFTQLRATWHTDSLDMVVLPSTCASRCHNCCIDGDTSPKNFGYHLVIALSSGIHKNTNVTYVHNVELFKSWILWGKWVLKFNWTKSFVAEGYLTRDKFTHLL
jgi:hypothetical protein